MDDNMHRVHRALKLCSPVPCLALGRFVSIVLVGSSKILTLCEGKFCAKTVSGLGFGVQGLEF